MTRTILVDGFNLGLDSGTGVATYARNLTHCVHELGFRTAVLYDNPRPAMVPADSPLQEVAFFDTETPVHRPRATWPRYIGEVLAFPFAVAARQIPIEGRVISRQFESKLPYFDEIWNSPDIFRRAARRFAVTQFFGSARLTVRAPKPVDIAHWTYPMPARITSALNIYTMHDLVPLRLPFTTLDDKRFYYSLSKMLAFRADHIVTVSETSKKDIVSLLGVSPDRVTNTYQTVEIPEKYASKPDDVVKREVEGTFNVTCKEYMLFFGAIEPKKNVARLIEAYLASKVDTPLLIVGKKTWSTEQDTRLVNDDATSYLEQMGSLTFRRRKVMQVDYAPFPLLVSLIRGAKAVIFPSLYEGFGLPILEAMMLKAPVIASNAGSIPEVAGEGAMLIDPYDVRALAQAIAHLDSNAEARARLSEAGHKRSGYFSKDAYKARLDALYGRLLAERGQTRQSPAKAVAPDIQRVAG